MIESAMSVPQPRAVPKDRIRFGRRLLVYLAVWLLAAFAFQVFLKPEGLTETDLSSLQQRISRLLHTPVMAVLGLAQSVTWPGIPGATGGFAAAACFVSQAILTLTRARRRPFIALMLVQALLLTVAVVHFVRQSRLPSGG